MGTIRRKSRHRSVLGEPWDAYERGERPPEGYEPTASDREDFVGVEFFSDLIVGTATIEVRPLKDHPFADEWTQAFK